MFSLDILILSIAMSVDAMLASFYYGISLSKKKILFALYLASVFSFFQFFMPFIGFYLGNIFYIKLSSYSKFIVCFIFFLLSFKILQDSFSKQDRKNIFSTKFIFILFLAILTSIDAFGAGINIKFLKLNILSSSVIIGSVTFISSFCGFLLGSFFETNAYKNCRS